MSSSPRAGGKNKANNDPADEMKRRSRRRLVGSIALFLTAIIVVPALVKNEPVKSNSPVELVIPPRPSADPKIDFSTNEVAKSSELQMPKVVQPTDKPESSEPKVVSKAPEQTHPKPVHKESKPEVKPAPVAKTVSPEKTEPKPVAKPKPEEAKPAAPKASEDPIAKFAQGEVYWVQVTALKDGVRAEQVRGKLAAKGYDAKVIPVKTSGGTVYRVRVGPIAGQSKADDIKAALSKIGYAGRVVQ